MKARSELIYHLMRIALCYNWVIIMLIYFSHCEGFSSLNELHLRYKRVWSTNISYSDRSTVKSVCWYSVFEERGKHKGRSKPD